MKFEPIGINFCYGDFFQGDHANDKSIFPGEMAIMSMIEPGMASEYYKHDEIALRIIKLINKTCIVLLSKNEKITVYFRFINAHRIIYCIINNNPIQNHSYGSCHYVDFIHELEKISITAEYDQISGPKNADQIINKIFAAFNLYHNQILKLQEFGEVIYE